MGDLRYLLAMGILVGCGSDAGSGLDDDRDQDGYEAAVDDCDDLDPETYPSAMELDDGVDQDCDGDAIELDLFDSDGDGYTPGYGSETDPTPDCDDSDPNVYPGAAEDPYNAIDDDCDFDTQDSDQDDDGYVASIDCNDEDPAINPAATEIDDGVDDDCDGDRLELDTFDLDNDGYTPLYGSDWNATPDCDDGDPSSYPGGLEIPDDGADNDCLGGDLVAASGVGTYVDGANGSCSDAAEGTIAVPNCTLSAALAFQTPIVFVAEGDYGAVSVDDTEVHLFGGFDSSWTRNLGTFTSRIAASADPALSCNGATLALEGISLLGDDTGTQDETHALWAVDCDLNLLRVNLDAGYADGSIPTTYGLRLLGTDATVSESSISGGQIRGNIPTTYGIFVDNNSSLRLSSSTVYGGDVSASSGIGDSIAIESGGSLHVRTSEITVGSVQASISDAYGVLIAQGSSEGALVEDSTIGGGVSDGDIVLVHIADEAVFRRNVFQLSGEGRRNGVAVQAETVLEGNIFTGTSNRTSVTAVASSAPLTAVHNVFAFESVESWRAIDAASSLVALNNIFFARTSSTPDTVQAIRYSGSTGELMLLSNDFHRISDFVRDLNGAGIISDLAALNTCGWSSCGQAAGNLSVDPMFVNIGAGDFHLQGGSLCIDAGTDPTGYLDWDEFLDIDLEPRPSAGGFDIGADEA